MARELPVEVSVFYLPGRKKLGGFTVRPPLIPSTGDRWVHPVTQETYLVVSRTFDWCHTDSGEEVVFLYVSDQSMAVPIEFQQKVLAFIERYRPALEKLAE